MRFKHSKVNIDDTEVEVRELSARQRRELFELHSKDTNPIEIQAHVIKMGCDMYSDKSVDDILDISGTAFDTLAKEILHISGLDEEAADEKNS